MHSDGAAPPSSRDLRERRGAARLAFFTSLEMPAQVADATAAFDFTAWGRPDLPMPASAAQQPSIDACGTGLGVSVGGGASGGGAAAAERCAIGDGAVGRAGAGLLCFGGSP